MTALRSQQATNWREGRRLRAWELFQEGWHQQRIAEALGVSKGAVSQWLSRAKSDGPQALHHRKPPGRRSKLTHQQRLQLLELLVQRPQALGFRGDVWTQPRVTQVIRRHFGGPIPPLPGGAHPQAVQLEPPKASETCQPAGRRRHPALERGALACPEKKARDEGRTIVFVDETGCYLLPLVVRTYAPRGQTPLLRAPLSRDHLSVISGITAHGWLHTKVQDRPFRGRDAARFLRHLTTHISVRLLVI